MNEITIHTGGAGDQTTLHVDWSDENNIRRSETIIIQVNPEDKPCILMVFVNGHGVYETTGKERVYECRWNSLKPSD